MANYNYDPFERGEYPVGVKSDEWVDKKRNRTLPVEIWYPAIPEYSGMDLDEKTKDKFTPGWVAEGYATEDDMAMQSAVREADEEKGQYPLVLLVHGWAGHRRESTFIGTHLASHGYIVVSPDIKSSLYQDVAAFLSSQEPHGKQEDLKKHFREIGDNRKGDIPFLVSTAIEQLNVNKDGIGITGASYGGWTSLMGPTLDERITASVPMCPGNYCEFDNDGATDLLEQIRYDYKRKVQTLFLVADRDSLVTLPLNLKTLKETPSPKRMVVLAHADHNHFVDDIDTGQAWLQEFVDALARLYPDTKDNFPLCAARVLDPQKSKLCPGKDAQTTWRGCILALMDAALKDNEMAYSFIEGDIDAIMKEKGIITYTIDMK